MKWSRGKTIQDRVDCGILNVETCDKCGSKYYPEASMEIIEGRLKEKGLWDSRKEIKVWNREAP